MPQTKAALDSLLSRLFRTETLAAIALVVLEAMNDLRAESAIGLSTYIAARSVVKMLGEWTRNHGPAMIIDPEADPDLEVRRMP